MSTMEMEDARRIAGLEVNALRFLEALPAGEYEGARIASRGTPVYDLNGELLFYRFPVTKRGARPAYADVAAHPALGAPFLAVASGLEWNEKALIAQAVKAARRVKHDEIRFVAYSFPKVGVQLRLAGKERMLLELGTWARVPPAPDRDRKPLEPGNFERWSLLDELPESTKRARAKTFQTRLRGWRDARLRRLDTSVVSKALFERLGPLVKLALFESRELHYSTRNTDHHPCYELRGQETNVWCVGASTQMLLDFYRYEYTQDRLAQELGLGTKANPNGLPYARVGDVVTAIEALTSNALDATMIVNPTFNLFRNEARANRPTISFVPGHSRTVAGYIRYNFSVILNQSPFRGLLVYDPWPPNAGVITRWENWDTQTYQYGYTAQVQLVP